MLDKSKIKKRLLKYNSCWITKKCLICNKGISRQDIENDNFEQIGKKYIHSNCFNKRIEHIEWR